MFKKIPRETIIRLSYYLRALNYFLEQKKEFVSSKDLAEYLNSSAHQVRKDFSYFGNFGRKGIGYSSRILLERLKSILGLDERWSVCIVGFGNLARALSLYKGFQAQGILIKVIFDIDEKKTNKRFGEVKVYHIKDMERVIRENNIKIGIVAVPQKVAQATAENLVKSGVKAILNFAPIKLNVPSHIIVKDVDLSCQLAYLTCQLRRLEG
jgi:redox-sensing transcriptional repressor